MLNFIHAIEYEQKRLRYIRPQTKVVKTELRRYYPVEPEIEARLKKKAWKRDWSWNYLFV